MDFNHGSLLHVTGPVMDLQSKAPAFLVEKLVSCGLGVLRYGTAQTLKAACLWIIRQFLQHLAMDCNLRSDMYLPCVYDSIFVFRPEVHLRNGPVIEGLHSSIIRFIASIPGNSFLSAGLLTLIPGFLHSGLRTQTLKAAGLRCTLAGCFSILNAKKAQTACCIGLLNHLFQASAEPSTFGLEASQVIYGFTSLFSLVRYHQDSILIAEVSQAGMNGIIRAVSFSTTDGLALLGAAAVLAKPTFGLAYLEQQCPGFFHLNPVVVPVGRQTLGRIFNVLGAAIDPFSDANLAS